MTLDSIKQSIKQTPFFECEDGLLYCADCMDILPQLPEGCVDLTVTSPPYNIGKDYGVYQDVMDWPDFIDWNEKIITQLRRISTHTVYIIGSHNNLEFFTKLRPVLEKCQPYKAMYAPRYLYMNPVEIAIYFWPENWKWNGIHKPPMLLQGQTPHWIPVTFGKVERLYGGHPATFPERIPEYFIQSFTEEGATVCDPFSGTGTTFNVAKKMNRKFIGSELAENFCRIAKDRIQAEQKGITVAELKRGQKVLF